MTRTKLLIIVGLVLAALGSIGLFFNRIPYEEDEASLNVGSVEATATVERHVEIPPLAAGVVLVAGLGLVSFGAAREP